MYSEVEWHMSAEDTIGIFGRKIDASMTLGILTANPVPFHSFGGLWLRIIALIIKVLY